MTASDLLFLASGFLAGLGLALVLLSLRGRAARPRRYLIAPRLVSHRSPARFNGAPHFRA
jgi:hypothetical protein